MTTVTQPGTFGAKLAAELSSRDMSARTLARLIVRQYDGKLDDADGR